MSAVASRAAPGGLRVAIVSDAQPGRNGVGTYYLDLCEHLAADVERVAFIAPGAGERDVARWCRVPLPGDATQRLELPSPFGLRRWLGRLRPHVVVAATPGPYGLLGTRYARQSGARLVVGLHTDFEALSALYWGRLLGRVNRWGLARLHRALFERADCVVANAPSMVRLAAESGSHDPRLVGTQLPRAFLDTPVRPCRERVEQIVFIGRLAAEKRVDRVLEAARRLPGRHFRIVGDGPLRSTVEQAAARLPNLAYAGWLDRAGIREALDASDLLVLPSAVEAFGTVALEALARERLALVSRGCGIRGWPALASGVQEMQPGEALAEAIERVAASEPSWRIAAARRARAEVVAMSRATRAEWLALLAPEGPGATEAQA